MPKAAPEGSGQARSESVKLLLQAAKEVSSMLGGKKEAAKEEQVTIDFAFASCVTIKDIKAGEAFSIDNIWVKRPGTGEILAKDFESLIGKHATKDIPTDTLLSWGMIN